MSHSVRMCSRCHVSEAHNCAYCIECKRITQRARYARMRAAQGPIPNSSKARRAINPDACNCGNRACNGLQCERASA